MKGKLVLLSAMTLVVATGAIMHFWEKDVPPPSSQVASAEGPSPVQAADKTDTLTAHLVPESLPAPTATEPHPREEAGKEIAQLQGVWRIGVTPDWDFFENAERLGSSRKYGNDLGHSNRDAVAIADQLQPGFRGLPTLRHSARPQHFVQFGPGWAPGPAPGSGWALVPATFRSLLLLNIPQAVIIRDPTGAWRVILTLTPGEIPPLGKATIDPTKVRQWVDLSMSDEARKLYTLVGTWKHMSGLGIYQWQGGDLRVALNPTARPTGFLARNKDGSKNLLLCLRRDSEAEEKGARAYAEAARVAFGNPNGHRRKPDEEGLAGLRRVSKLHPGTIAAQTAAAVVRWFERTALERVAAAKASLQDNAPWAAVAELQEMAAINPDSPAARDAATVLKRELPGVARKHLRQAESLLQEGNRRAAMEICRQIVAFAGDTAESKQAQQRINEDAVVAAKQSLQDRPSAIVVAQLTQLAGLNPDSAAAKDATAFLKNELPAITRNHLRQAERLLDQDNQSKAMEIVIEIMAYARGTDEGIQAEALMARRRQEVAEEGAVVRLWDAAKKSLDAGHPGPMERLVRDFPRTPHGKRGSKLLLQWREEKQEGYASEKLSAAKKALVAAPRAAREWLQEIIDEYPGTRAAQEASELLKRRPK